MDMAESHVVSALANKRAEIAGTIARTQQQLGQFRADLVHPGRCRAGRGRKAAQSGDCGGDRQVREGSGAFGAKAGRPGLAQALVYARSGDVLVVWTYIAREVFLSRVIGPR